MTSRNIRRPPIAALFVLAIISPGCGDDSSQGEPTPTFRQCPSSQVYDSITLRCVDELTDAGEDVGPNDVSVPDADSGRDVAPDIVVEEEDVMRPDAPAPVECDQDRDGHRSIACGGMDCDDDNFSRSPSRLEVCDDLDNNCNDLVNDGIECSFYAHTGEGLYRIDPFQKQMARVTDAPRLFDIDTHPNGTLYGIAADELYGFDAVANVWYMLGSFPQFTDGTGLAINSQGVGTITAADSIYRLDISLVEATWIGDVGGSFYSSGDCVLNKQDTLYMTSKADGENDTLVLVDGATGVGTAVGNTGFRHVFGLTAGWGKLFGLTSSGELIEINTQTGAGTLIHVFEGMSWYGAASTPAR